MCWLCLICNRISCIKNQPSNGIWKVIGIQRIFFNSFPFVKSFILLYKQIQIINNNIHIGYKLFSWRLNEQSFVMCHIHMMWLCSICMWWSETVLLKQYNFFFINNIINMFFYICFIVIKNLFIWGVTKGETHIDSDYVLRFYNCQIF